MQQLYGNTEVAAVLHRMVESGHIPHAILLHEDDGAGAFPLVLNFLEELYDGNPRVGKLIHPDIHFVFPVAGPDKPVSLQFAGPSALKENKATSRSTRPVPCWSGSRWRPWKAAGARW